VDREAAQRGVARKERFDLDRQGCFHYALGNVSCATRAAASSGRRV
jgi:hypothetical protein